MPEKKPLPSSAFARTPQQKRWTTAGIPREFWPLLPDLAPSFISYKVNRGPVINAIYQRQIYRALRTEIKHNHPVVPIWSSPTDDGALLVACSIAIAYLGAGYPCECFDLSRYAPRVSEFKRYPRVLILHNLTMESPPDRIQAARDMILKWRDAMRLIVIGGVPKNPEEWWKSSLHYRGTYYLVSKDIH